MRATLSRLLSELRNPTTWRAKIVAVILAIAVFSFLTLGVVSGFFLLRALNPQAGERFDPTVFLGNSETVEFQTPDGDTHAGWFFPGHRGAPVVVLCHGYKSSRTEILTLATSLQQHRYNVYTFNFAGHGENPVGYTTLGPREARELEAALVMLAGRPDVDTERIGLWGYSMGAYAAVRIAPAFPEVKAVVLDSVPASPEALLRLELERLGTDAVPLVTPTALAEFRLISWFFGGIGHLGPEFNRLVGVPKLFIVGNDAPGLAAMSQQLYAQAPGPKEMVVMPRTRMASMMARERRDYENVVVSFFFRNLPLVAGSS